MRKWSVMSLSFVAALLSLCLSATANHLNDDYLVSGDSRAKLSGEGGGTIDSSFANALIEFFPNGTFDFGLEGVYAPTNDKQTKWDYSYNGGSVLVFLADLAADFEDEFNLNTVLLSVDTFRGRGKNDEAEIEVSFKEKWKLNAIVNGDDRRSKFKLRASTN